MKQTLTVLLALAGSCCMMAQNKTFLVKANFKGLSPGKIMYMYRNPVTNQSFITDSIETKTDDFEIRGTIAGNEPVIMVLQRMSGGNPGSSMPVRFFIQNGDTVTVNGGASAMDAATCSGNKYNKQLAELTAVELQDKHEMYRLFKEQYDKGAGQNGPSPEITAIQKRIADNQLAFVKAHPDYRISATVLAMELQNNMSDAELKTYYDGFTAEVKASQYGRMIQERFEEKKKFGEGAASLPFTKKDMAGNTIKLADYKGQYVLLDFWGSWCGPCRKGNPHLKELNAKYKDKGLVMIGIANESKPTLQESKNSWQQAVKEDGLDWIQVLNDEDIAKTNVAALYGIKAFPTKILIDKNGVIIGRYMGTNPAEQDPLTIKLKEVLGE